MCCPIILYYCADALCCRNDPELDIIGYKCAARFVLCTGGRCSIRFWVGNDRGSLIFCGVRMRVLSPSSRAGKRVYLSMWDLLWAVASPLVALYARDVDIFLK